LQSAFSFVTEHLPYRRFVSDPVHANVNNGRAGFDVLTPD